MKFEGLVNSIRSEAIDVIDTSTLVFEGLVNSIRSEALFKVYRRLVEFEGLVNSKGRRKCK